MTAKLDSHADGPLGAVADAILAERAAEGDVAAFEVLIRRYGPMVRAYIARVVGSYAEADDIAQEAFYTAWKRLAELRDPSAVKAWLMRVASRLAYSHLRRNPVETELPSYELAMGEASQPESIVVRNAQLRALSAALDALPEDQRTCWLLREAAGLSYDEIAEEMELTTATVRGKLARARASIYTRMEEWR